MLVVPCMQVRVNSRADLVTLASHRCLGDLKAITLALIKAY